MGPSNIPGAFFTTCKLNFIKENPLAVVPEYKSIGASGMDLCSVEEKVIQPGEFCLVDTGLRVEIPYRHECQIRPRSGLAAKNGVTVLNTPGTIDQDYTGVVKVILINHGKEAFKINIGDRIAQMVVAQVERAHVTVSDTLTTKTERGDGGFGSTGLN